MGKQYIIEVVEKPKSSVLGWLIFLGVMFWIFAR
jgi:hypothetical protein